MNRGLDQLVPGNKENRWIYGGNSGFTAWPGLDCYIRYERFLDDATKQRYRKVYTGAVFYKRLSTSNHKIMAAVGRYLATQIWGSDAFHPDPFFQAEDRRQGISGPKLSVRRNVGEPDTSKGSHLWITNPSADDNNTDGNKPTGIHTHGVTGFEQEVQHRDALLFVFNIPADFRNPYVLGYVPGGYRASLTVSNRIFLHYGSLLVAVSSATPFEWNPKSGIRAPAGKPHDGDSEFRVMATKTALAIETALPSEFLGGTPADQLAPFRDRLLAKSKIEFQPADKSVGRYTDRAGHTLECVFDGPDNIDGTVVDYARWPVLENPWMHQDTHGDRLIVNSGSEKLIYDFAQWKRLSEASKQPTNDHAQA